MLLPAGHSPACAPAVKPTAARNASAAIARPRLVKLDIVISFVSLWLAFRNAADGKMPRAFLQRKYPLALISIASRYFTPPDAACIFVVRTRSRRRRDKGSRHEHACAARRGI